MALVVAIAGMMLPAIALIKTAIDKIFEKLIYVSLLQLSSYFGMFHM